MNDTKKAYILVNDLCASYKNAELPVLNKVSARFETGELVCLCGLNGSGKSTFLSVLAGIKSPALIVSGEPEICVEQDSKYENPVKIGSLKRKECAKLISYMTQNENSIWDFTVRDIILTGRYAYSKNGNYSAEDEKLTDEVIKELELEEFADRSVHSLSGGEFQKVRIARSIVQTPKFLILDEPAANLDFVYEPKLMELLRKISVEKRLGIIISIHDINHAAQYADKVLMFPKHKPSIFGKTADVFTLENLKSTFGAVFICKETKSFQLSL